jgi:GNAT superfamily N-acetyltransferase
MKIRKATKKDVPSIIELWKELVSCHRKRFWSPSELFRFKKNSVSLARKYIKKLLNARNSRVFVADMDGKVVGYAEVTIKKLPAIYVHDREVHVGVIFVDGLHRRKGIGTRLLKEAERWAKSRGIFSLALTVFEKNKPALSAYKKFGFKEHHLKMSKVI